MLTVIGEHGRRDSELSRPHAHSIKQLIAAADDDYGYVMPQSIDVLPDEVGAARKLSDVDLLMAAADRESRVSAA